MNSRIPPTPASARRRPAGFGPHVAKARAEHEAATARCRKALAEIRHNLTRYLGPSAGADFGDVGDALRLALELEAIADRLMRRGEFSPEA
jgi:hypothetical protein